MPRSQPFAGDGRQWLTPIDCPELVWRRTLNVVLAPALAQADDPIHFIRRRRHCEGGICSFGVPQRDASAGLVYQPPPPGGLRSYSNRVPTLVAQPMPTRLLFTSSTSIRERDAKSSPFPPSSRAALTRCDPRSTPLAL